MQELYINVWHVTPLRGMGKPSIETSSHETREEAVEALREDYGPYCDGMTYDYQHTIHNRFYRGRMIQLRETDLLEEAQELDRQETHDYQERLAHEQAERFVEYR